MGANIMKSIPPSRATIIEGIRSHYPTAQCVSRESCQGLAYGQTGQSYRIYSGSELLGQGRTPGAAWRDAWDVVARDNIARAWAAWEMRTAVQWPSNDEHMLTIGSRPGRHS